MSLRNFLLAAAAAALPALVLAQDGSVCLVKTTVVPVYITTTIGGPAVTNTMSSQGTATTIMSTATVSPTPVSTTTYNLASASAGATIVEGIPIVLMYSAPQTNIAATIDLVQVPAGAGSYKRDTTVVLVQTLTTSAMGGNYTWTPDTTLTPANNYALRVSQGGSQVELSKTFALVAAGGVMSSSMSSSMSVVSMTSTSAVSTASNSAVSMSAPVSASMSAAVSTSMSASTSAPAITTMSSSSSVTVLSTGGVATVSGGGAVVETQYVQGPPSTSVINTFSTTVTATSTAYAVCHFQAVSW